MTREERLARIAKLEADQVATLVDMEERRQARELTEDYVVKKAPAYDPIEDQLWQQRNYRLQPAREPVTSNDVPREDQLVTVGYLDKHTDTMIENSIKYAYKIVAEETAKLRTEIAALREQTQKLEKEISLVRQLANGTIKTVQGRNHHVA